MLAWRFSTRGADAQTQPGAYLLLGDAPAHELLDILRAGQRMISPDFSGRCVESGDGFHLSGQCTLGGASEQHQAAILHDFPAGREPEFQRYVHGKNGGSQESSVQVDVVMDASSRDTVLGNQLRLKRHDTIFIQYAIHTWFENSDRRKLAHANWISTSSFTSCP
jgi:hypothetical protein